MKFTYNFVLITLFGCLLGSDIAAGQDQQGCFNYICSFFYGKSAQKNKILSFDERLLLFEEQFKNTQKSADFNEKIMALQMTGRTHQECLEISRLTQQYGAQHREPLSLKHYDEAMLYFQYKDAPEARKDLKYDEIPKLEHAYHEATHAVETITQDEDSETALYCVSIKPYKNSGGRFVTIPLLQESTGDDIHLMKCALDRCMAGGVGEIVFKVPGRYRTFDNFDAIDKNHEFYDYLDFITRCSTQSDIDIVCNLADMMLQIEHDDDNYQPTVDERTRLVQESLKRVKAKAMQHKDKIEKLAHRLVEKETVYADEAYEICGKQRPKFYFEK